MMTDDGVVCAPKNESLDIGIEFAQMSGEYLLNQYSFKNPILNERNKFRCCNFLNMDSIIMNMYPLFIGSISDSRFGCQNANLSISSLNNTFRARNSYAEDFFIRKPDLLKVSDGMSSCRVAGKYNNFRSLIE